MISHRAILIGNGSFALGSDLAPLAGPTKDIKRIADALTRPGSGLFESRNVLQLVNRSKQEVLTAVGEYAAEPCKQLLVYFSGHGKLNINNQFFLCVHNTSSDNLAATGIWADDLNNILAEARTRTVVMILDCCHSGSYRFKGGDVARAFKAFQGDRAEETSGRFLLSSTPPEHLSLDGPDGSIFTTHVVDALTQADGDVDGDGMISLHDIFSYARAKLKAAKLPSPQLTVERGGDYPSIGRVARVPVLQPLPAVPIPKPPERRSDPLPLPPQPVEASPKPVLAVAHTIKRPVAAPPVLSVVPAVERASVTVSESTVPPERRSDPLPLPPPPIEAPPVRPVLTVTRAEPAPATRKPSEPRVPPPAEPPPAEVPLAKSPVAPSTNWLGTTDTGNIDNPFQRALRDAWDRKPYVPPPVKKTSPWTAVFSLLFIVAVFAIPAVCGLPKTQAQRDVDEFNRKMKFEQQMREQQQENLKWQMQQQELQRQQDWQRQQQDWRRQQDEMQRQLDETLRRNKTYP